MDVIVVGVDGSQPSQRAVLWAADEAARRGCALKVILAVAERRGSGPHLTDLAPQATQVTDRARELARNSHPGLDVGGAAVAGHPGQVLVDESVGAATVVVGSRGHGGFHDMLLGSTSLHTAMHAHCPVAVVRGTTIPESQARAPVVVGVDGSDPSQAAAQLAAYEADLRGVPLTVLHAWPSPADEALGPWALAGQTGILDAETAGVAEDAAAAARTAYPRVDVTARTVRRRPAGALLAASKRACLVVVGCRGHGGFTGLLLGSVSQAQVHHAGCPVLVDHRHHDAS